MKDVENMIKEASEESQTEEQQDAVDTSRKKSVKSKRDSKKKMKEQKTWPLRTFVRQRLCIVH